MSTVSIFDDAIPTLTKLQLDLQDPRRVNRAVAASVLPVFQNHLRKNAATNRNKFGVRGGFWNRMLSGTTAEGTSQAALIRMPAEVGLRVRGGTVKPKKSKFLAIPARAEAYGKSPRDFTDLRFIALENGGAALIRAEQTRLKIGRKRKDGSRSVSAGESQGGEVMFWLRRSATIRGNQNLLPTTAEVRAAAMSGIGAFLK